jgi:hypothetical protein
MMLRHLGELAAAERVERVDAVLDRGEIRTAITAPCAFVNPVGAAIIGALAD